MKMVIDEIHSKINAAKKRSCNNDEILLVAVSKNHSYERILEAQQHGINVFGENKVQELVDKYPHVKGVSWHLIGNLQRNKVKYIIDKVDMIHSLDNLELAKEINKRAASIGRQMPVLIQVNIGKEATKGGLFQEDVVSFMDQISELDNLLVNGLMTIPPISDDEHRARDYFKQMYALYQRIKKLEYKNFDIKYLSMGMTDDYEIAIEEGANIIRIGTGIFGRRDYTKVNQIITI